MTAAFPPVDLRWMDLALRLGRRGAGRCRRNPTVGAVIVKDSRCVGVGWHEWESVRHAEGWALERAGGQARGATAYVTLEPCSRQGRTPPCDEHLIAAGISRVVYGASDPTQGRSPGRLEAAGVRVEQGCRREEAEDLARPFLHVSRAGRALITVKAACGPDGRMATVGGESKWLSGDASRLLYRRLRGRFDGVAVGIGTVLADDPHLGVGTSGSEEPSSGPAAVVLDGALRMPPGSRLVERAGRGAELLVYCRPAPDPERRASLEEAGAVVVEVPAGTGARGVDPEAVARDLAGRGILTLVVEGGSLLLGELFDRRLADRILLFQPPRMLGGAAAPQLWAGRGSRSLEEAPRLHSLDMFRLGADEVLEADLEW